MTIRDLIEALEEAAQELGDDAEVRAGYQPSWPLSGYVDRVRVLDWPPPRGEDKDDDSAVPDPESDDPEERIAAAQWRADEERIGQHAMCWIVVGYTPSSPESPYAPRELWE